MTAKTYKLCDKKCGSCRKCKEFQKVVSQIDLSKKSPHQVATENRLKDYNR